MSEIEWFELAMFSMGTQQECGREIADVKVPGIK